MFVLFPSLMVCHIRKKKRLSIPGESFLKEKEEKKKNMDNYIPIHSQST